MTEFENLFLWWLLYTWCIHTYIHLLRKSNFPQIRAHLWKKKNKKKKLRNELDYILIIINTGREHNFYLNSFVHLRVDWMLNQGSMDLICVLSWNRTKKKIPFPYRLLHSYSFFHSFRFASNILPKQLTYV